MDLKENYLSKDRYLVTVVVVIIVITEHLKCTKYCAEYFTHISVVPRSQQLFEVYTFLITILQMKRQMERVKQKESVSVNAGTGAQSLASESVFNYCFIVSR